jgi:hypothetical protein
VPIGTWPPDQANVVFQVGKLGAQFGPPGAPVLSMSAPSRPFALLLTARALSFTMLI